MGTQAILLFVLVLIVIYLSYKWWTAEGYRPCNDCNPLILPSAGLMRLNPCEWPSSAWSNPDAAYNSPSAKIQVAPLTHLETPDHVVLTN